MIPHIIANWGKKLFEFRNILDVTYDSRLVNGAYGGSGISDSDTAQPPNRDRAVAAIRELLTGETAAVRQRARDVSTSISALQIFTDAIETIAEKLVKMLDLVKKTLVPDCSQTQAERMEQQFQDLSRGINKIVSRTEYQFNKPFSGSGKTFSISIGNGSKINIFARDFRFDAQGLNLKTNPQTALSKVNDAITNIDEYKTYLDRQAVRLSDITASIESEIQVAMGINIKDFQPGFAELTADYAASLIPQDKQTSINTQANLTPNEILKLLKDGG